MKDVAEFDIDLGIESIDAEHRDLVRLFSAFARAIKAGIPMNEVHAIVQETIAAANAHFEHEEGLADEAGYPLVEDHRFRHRHLRMQMTTLVGDTVGIEAQDPVTLGHLFEMQKLLEEHIDGPDRELTSFLKEAGYR
jgi:hemerythrin-like metal-binding protein